MIVYKGFACVFTNKNVLKYLSLWGVIKKEYPTLTALPYSVFSVITPVFSVTRSFINHSNIQIWCSRNRIINVEKSTVFLMNINFKRTALLISFRKKIIFELFSVYYSSACLRPVSFSGTFIQNTKLCQWHNPIDLFFYLLYLHENERGKTRPSKLYTITYL